MQDNKELLNAIDEVQSTSAKHQVLSDLCAFFEKYRRKQATQLRDISCKYEKVKALGRNDKEALRILTRKNQLQCQMIECLSMEKEFAERCLKAGEEVVAACNNLKELQSHEDE